MDEQMGSRGAGGQANDRGPCAGLSFADRRFAQSSAHRHITTILYNHLFLPCHVTMLGLHRLCSRKCFRFDCPTREHARPLSAPSAIHIHSAPTAQLLPLVKPPPLCYTYVVAPSKHASDVIHRRRVKQSIKLFEPPPFELTRY